MNYHIWLILSFVCHDNLAIDLYIFVASEINLHIFLYFIKKIVLSLSTSSHLSRLYCELTMPLTSPIAVISTLISCVSFNGLFYIYYCNSLFASSVHALLHMSLLIVYILCSTIYLATLSIICHKGIIIHFTIISPYFL